MDNYDGVIFPPYYSRFYDSRWRSHRNRNAQPGFMAKDLKTNLRQNCIISMGRFLLPMLDLIPMEVIFHCTKPNLPYSAKRIEPWGPAGNLLQRSMQLKVAPHLDRRHTVFGQLLDEQSYRFDKIAQVETGAMHRPVEDGDYRDNWGWRRMKIMITMGPLQGIQIPVVPLLNLNLYYRIDSYIWD